MNTIRIPNRYRKQLSRITDKERLWIFDSLMSLSLGENVKISDNLAGDILELIWRDCIQMERKNSKFDQNSVGNCVAGNPAGNPAGMYPPEVNGSEVNGSEVKKKERKGNDISDLKNRELEDLKDFWNNFELKKPVKNKKIKIGEKVFMQSRLLTEEMIKKFKKHRKEFGIKDFQIAIEQYAIERCGRDPTNEYSSHKFSFGDFLTQKNGFLKFVEKKENLEIVSPKNSPFEILNS